MWALLALAAGFLQTARNGLARSLSPGVSPALISWARFAFNLPFSTALALALYALAGWPMLTPRFLLLCALTGVTQLLANIALVAAFRHANFAQSIVVHKLEVVLTAVAGAWIFREMPSAAGWLGIGACGVGVLLMNVGRDGEDGGWRRAFSLDPGSVLALGCAVLLVVASFALKQANLAFEAANPDFGFGRFGAAANTLFHTTWIEVVLLSGALLAWDRRAFRSVRPHAGRMALIGLTGFAGSLCWFWAYSLTLVAYVKAVGQIEAVLAVVLALRVWHEREVVRQLPGVALVVLGILAVLMG